MSAWKREPTMPIFTGSRFAMVVEPLFVLKLNREEHVHSKPTMAIRGLTCPTREYGRCDTIPPCHGAEGRYGRAVGPRNLSTGEISISPLSFENPRWRD